MIELTDAKKRAYTTCKRKMKSLGYSDLEAEIHCTQYVMQDDEGEKKDDFDLLFVDDIREIGTDPGRAGVSETGVGETGHAANISLRKFTSLIKVLRSKLPLKVKHMSLGPFTIELPMKNLNRLQTKLERMITEEGKNLTAEQQAARAAYAKFMKKDSEDLILEEMIELIKKIVEDNKDKSDDEKEDLIFDCLSKPSYERIHVDSTAFLDHEKINDKMNNIIKAPIILAREMIQEYRFLDDIGGERVERHFKPYDELKNAILGLKKLHMIVEHKDSWELTDTIGCVQQLKADDDIRGIRGMGYFVESKLPITIKNLLNEGKPIQVSIGFMAELGGSGTYNNEDYEFAQRNIILDHLAICLDSVARCDLEKCGVNVENKITSDAEKLTVISKPDYYYNISNIITKNDQEPIKINIEEESIGDSMEDSFPDPKSGKMAASPEAEDLELFLQKFRVYINGETDPEKWLLKKEQILALFKEKPKKEGKKMEDSEYKDAIATRDEEIKKLRSEVKAFQEEKRQDKIKEIKSFTDKFTDSELSEKTLEQLRDAADIVSRFAPSMEKPETLPIEAPNKEKFDDNVKDEISPDRLDPTKMFTENNKEFNMSGFRT